MLQKLGSLLGNQRQLRPCLLHIFLGNAYSPERLMIMRVSQILGKREPSDEEIRNWIKEGWKFTKRTRKGHIYITRRMGANKERSLGPFKQTLWDRIEKIKREPGEPQKETDPISLFYSLVELNRAFLYPEDCMNKDDEGYCTYWRWSPDYSLLRYRGDLEMKEVRDEGNPVYLFRAHAKYCGGCNAYVSSRMKVSTT